MRSRLAWLAIVLACVLGAAGCSKSTKVVAPQPEPPAVAASEFEYSLNISSGGWSYAVTVTHAEYADANGIVRQISHPSPLWTQIVKLRPGQRMYLRADVTYESTVTGGAQIVGATLYRGDLLERVDGPGTATTMIDQILK